MEMIGEDPKLIIEGAKGYDETGIHRGAGTKARSRSAEWKEGNGKRKGRISDNPVVKDAFRTALCAGQLAARQDRSCGANRAGLAVNERSWCTFARRKARK